MLILRKQHVIVCVRYYRPDYSHILQDFTWGTEDVIPDIPRVHEFLNFWKKNIEATIKEVIVSASNVREYNNTNFYKILN